MGERPKLTEKIVSDLLRTKHHKVGNGGSGEWAYFSQVRNAAGFDANRTFDGLAIGLWPSRGHAIHIFEIKVSRSDWQRELAKPDKAEDAAKIADHFCIVAPVGCVHDGELPATWGLIEVTGNGDDKPWALRTKKAAPALHDRTRHPDLTRSFVVALLRAVPGAVPGGRNLGPLDEAERAAYQRGVNDTAKAAAEAGRRAASLAQSEADRWRKVLDALREAGAEHPSEYALIREAAAVAAALNGAQVEWRLDHLRTQLAGAVDLIDSLRASHG